MRVASADDMLSSMSVRVKGRARMSDRMISCVPMAWLECFVATPIG